MALEKFFSKVIVAGYDGIDTWIPEDASERKKFLCLLNEHQLPIVYHQFHAKGTSILRNKISWNVSVKGMCCPTKGVNFRKINQSTEKKELKFCTGREYYFFGITFQK